jgi:hypothetical protein
MSRASGKWVSAKTGMLNGEIASTNFIIFRDMAWNLTIYLTVHNVVIDIRYWLGTGTKM